MKLKKEITIALIVIMALMIFTYARHLGIVGNSYLKISEDTKEKIISIIKKSKGEIPNLQTDNCNASWIKEAHIKQKEMMDKVLNTLTVVGESRKGKPDKFIIATFYDNMQVYIPYNKKDAHNNIIVEIDNHYYIAVAKEDDIKTIINYMEKQGVLKE
ncbi:hypothetical protein [Clostridium sp. JS66]|uniref:hypothetical protein n=1 Tax=Clostridium sp. JS66 TaxID=3064705 RepID=UPI00298EC87B|nr:hypothetical protein [Clostridium sp. JS66]WPC42760.1 hypothetical protein Q6H37_04625 [Clostridium sp. JS66]